MAHSTGIYYKFRVTSNVLYNRHMSAHFMFYFWYHADELDKLKKKNKELERDLSFYRQMYTNYCAPLEESSSTSTLLNDLQ